MEARHKLNGLGLPRQWKVMTSTLLLLFTFAIGNVWGAATNLASSVFIKTYLTKTGSSNPSASDLMSEFPAYLTGSIQTANGTGVSSSITSPHDFSAISSSTKYWRIKLGSSNTITISEVSNIAKIHIYGGATNDNRTLKVTFKTTVGDIAANEHVDVIWGTAATTIVDHVYDLSAVEGYSSSSAYTLEIKSASGGDYQIYGIYLEAGSSGPSVSSFSPATGATVKSGTTVTVTGSTGSTIYYKWATSTQTADDIYNSGSGSHGTADAATVTSSGINSANGTTLYAIARKGTTNSAVASASYTIDDDGPELVSSNPANSATDVAVEGTIVLTFDEDVAAIDDSKFSLSGATIGAVAIDGTDATKVNVPYSGAANSATVTLSVQAEAVEDALENKSAALSDIAFTTVAAETPTCPSGMSISGTTTYTEGQTISLTAALSAGNGSITYNWYKGADLATAKAAGSIGTGTSYSKASCVTGDAGSYWCEATKDECSPASNAEAYAVTVNTLPTSSSINIEQLVLDNGKSYDIGAALNTAHIGYVDKDALDSLTTAADRNEPYLGLKFKKSTSTITIVVPDGQYLKVKFGARKTTVKVSVNGATATDAAITDDVYTLAAATGVRQVVFSVTENNKTIVLKQVKINEEISSVTLPWLVTYDAGEHGTCATAKQTWTGTALTLPAVTPESGWNFEGWNDDEDNPVSSPYTPTKNVTLTAQYTAQASPYDLTSLTYKIGTGAATNVGYTDGTYTYNIVLPYKASYDAITVTPVLKEATSYLKGDEVLTVSSLPGAATFTVVEAGGASEQLYTVNFTKAPKDGVSIIKAIADDTNQDIKAENLTGLYKKAGHIYTSGSYKLDQKRYFMVQLEDGKNFQGGDVVEINVSSVNDCNGFTIYSNISGDDFADGDLIVDTHDETGAAAKVSAGINKITLPSYAGSNKLYVARKNGTEKYLNAGINQVEVKRAMNPVLKSITFAGVEATVNEAGKTVTVTVPNATNLGTMAVVPTIFRNAPHATTPEAVTTNGGEWVEGSGNTYRIMDKDGDYTDYTVTITRAAVSHDATLSALTVDGNAVALEDGVYTYAYEYETGTAVSPAPVVAATAHDANAKSVEITQASDKKGTATVVVTAEDNSTTQTYTINFSISTKIKVVIFDGNDAKATAIKGSPHATGASWVVTGLTAADDDKGTSYATKVATGGSTGASKNIAVTIPVNYQPFFEIAQATNNNGTERKAFITTTANGSGTKLYELANSVTNTPTKGMSEGLTEETTYYIHANASINFYEVILYLEPLTPKAATPTLSGLADLAACTLGTDELTVTASDLDGGTAHYQWYKVVEGDDPDEAVGTDANTYAPAVAGNYYVVVTNQKDGCRDNSKKSDEVTVSVKTHTEITVAPLNQRATVGNNATLSVTAIGDGILHYTWYTCDDEAGTNPVAVDPANDAATYEVAVTAAMNQWYKVTVHSDCGADQSATAKVSEFVPATPANVTESIVWDWTSSAWTGTENISFANQTDEQLLADVDAAVPNNAEFHSDMLYGIGQHVWRPGNKFFQGKQIRFNTTVAGRVRVHFRSTGSGKNVQVAINGSVAGSGDAWQWTDYVYVPAGGVTIVCNGLAGNETGLTRIDQIEFQTPSYVRTEMLGAGVYGTICVDHNVPEGGVRGVTVYKIAGREPQYGKIAFDEVTEMVAGVPYVFIAHGNEMALYYGETTVANPVNGNGMYGTFVAQTLTELDGIYYFAKSALWSCVDLTSLNLPANRAYVKLSEIDYLGSSSPAPGRKRLLIGVNGAPAVATGIESAEANEAPRKVLINGELFILRGEKMYDAKGQLVK